MNFKDKYQKFCQDAHLVGSSCVIVKNDEIVEETCYGFKSIAKNTLVSSNTIFRIASISKIVVAMSVLTLIEEGKASIDDDISDILGFKIRNPHYPDKKITIKMLMTQTSSITDGFDDENPQNDNEIRGYNGVNGTSWDVKLKELLVPNEGKYYTDLTWDKKEPGTHFIYSNFGCGILACIVEALSGQLFTEYVEKRILKPLKLDASFRACNIICKEEIADTYYQLDNQEKTFKVARTAESFVNSCYPIFNLKENYRGPAGGLFICMPDLSKIMRVLLNDGVCDGVRILKKETVDLMLQLHWFGIDSTYNAKGLQLKIFDFENKVFKGHTGSAYGVISFLFFNREEQIGICFITNGGYYKYSKQGFYDVEENIFKAFLDDYWPKQTNNLEFKFKLNDNFGTVDDRIIKFDHKALVKGEEIYMSIYDIASGLNVVPIIDGQDVKINKNGNSYKLALIDIKEVPLKELLENLNINFLIKKDEIIIKL